MDLKEISFSMRNCIDLAQDRGYWRALANAALNLRVQLAMELFSCTKRQMKSTRSIKRLMNG